MSDPTVACPACSAEFKAGSVFCPDCGAAAPTAHLDPSQTPAGGMTTGSDDYRDRLQRAIGENFRLEELLGEGGFGRVFKAHDISLDRPVAIKAIRDDIFHSPQTQERFRLEALAVAKIRHPGIAPVYAVGEKDGLVFIVMAFIAGESLRSRLARGPLPIEDVVRITRDVAAALQVAHDLGVIHRDVKPENVMLEEPEQRAVLMDFGIAKPAEGGMDLTGTGSIIGTPAYLSPEQACGDPLDQRSDLYSLGVMVFQMLTGELPYRAETGQAMISQHLTGTPTPIESLRPDVPRSLAEAVRVCLQKSPDDRFESGTELIHALDKAPATGAQIFLSYKKEDVDQARQFAHALEARGFSVWWDRKIAPGEEWAEVIENAIGNAGAVVVLWTARSVSSKWVHKEARKGESRGNLLPVMLEAVDVPFEFEHVQAANLIGWDFTTPAPAFEALVKECESVLGGRKSMGIPAPQIPDAPTQPIATPKGARKPAPLLLAGIIPFAALLIYSLVPVAPRSVNLREVVTTHAEMTVAPSGGGAQLVTESIDARSVLVDGATGVYVPATVDGAGRQLATDLVYLEAAEGGTVTVNGLRIEPGGIIAVEPGSAPGEVRLVLRELTDLTLSVSGPVDVLTGDDALGTLDFGASGAVNVTPGSLMSLEIALADSIRGVSCGTCSPFRLLSDVEVQQLRLSRVEQDVSLERTAAERISTIRSGRVEVGDRTLSLEEGDDVRFDGYPGTVRSLDVSDAPYTLDADADLAPNATVDGTSVQPIRFGTMRLPFQVALALMIVIQALAYVVLRRRNA